MAEPSTAEGMTSIPAKRNRLPNRKNNPAIKPLMTPTVAYDMVPRRAPGSAPAVPRVGAGGAPATVSSASATTASTGIRRATPDRTSLMNRPIPMMKTMMPTMDTWDTLWPKMRYARGAANSIALS